MPKTVIQWGEELVPRVVDRLINKFVGTGRAELVNDFTIHYPFDIVYEQLALPPGDSVIFQKLAVGLMCIGIDPAHAMEASHNLGVYLESLLVSRGRAGSDDLIGMLARAEVEGERLPTDIAVSFLRQLMNAAGDTTYRSTGSFFVGLLSNPDQLAAVKADRSLIPAAIEEALRWEGPLTVLTRQTTREVVLDGVVIPKGAKIDVVQGSANHDPAQFENPDVFNIFRPRKRNFAFAYGPHICIGQHLARVEMQRAINMLLDRLPNLRLDPDCPPPVICGLNSRAPLELRVKFDT
jgi:cytochrome P450